VVRLDINASRNSLERGDPKIEFGLKDNLCPSNRIHTRSIDLTVTPIYGRVRVEGNVNVDSVLGSAIKILIHAQISFFI
jgi:hypothetical protein